LNNVSSVSRPSLYLTFSREEWALLRDATPLPLSEAELTAMQGLNERVSVDEVTQIYLPLSRLLNLNVDATQHLFDATYTFLGASVQKVPYIIGIAGSVAVGKSTTARIVQALLARWPNHPKVDLITTDGFLYPNRVLEERDLMKRKGFPESYDVKRLIRFLSDVKSGRAEVKAPVYSHLCYDILADQYHVVRQPDIMILEGLNVLQSAMMYGPGQAPRAFVSDFFDFSIYVDADEKNIIEWYVERFQTLRQTAFLDTRSFFRRYARLSVQEAEETALNIWREINGINLRENIAPTRGRARLILSKGEDHSIQRVSLRK